MDDSPTYCHCFIISVLFFSRTLMPLFDPDTSMLFTPGKADRNLAFFEVSDANKVTLGNVKIFFFFFYLSIFVFAPQHIGTF